MCVRLLRPCYSGGGLVRDHEECYRARRARKGLGGVAGGVNKRGVAVCMEVWTGERGVQSTKVVE